MRLHNFLLFCMACLMVAAQAAPAVADQLGFPERRFQRRKGDVVRARRAVTSPDIVEVAVEGLAKDVKVEASSDTARRFALEPHLGEGEKQYFGPLLNAKAQAMLSRYQALEEEARLEKKIKERHMHYADTLHIANHGQRSTKFPMITRFSASVGAVAAVFNVFNTVVAAKTTHAATVPFSSPPTPPTLLDNAGRWNGESVTLLKPLSTSSNPKRKRDLPQFSPLEAEYNGPSMKKRWLLAAGAGTAVGAMFAPGFWGMVRHKGSDAEKPPFDPYNPDMLKQKDPLAVLATSPGQAVPQINPVPASVGSMATLRVDNLAGGGSRGSDTSELLSVAADSMPLSANLVPVLQKRASNEELEKRQFVNGAGSSLWSKIAMAATAGSAIPLIYHGVAHSRWRAEHPRDRDIIGELDDTPTYGAVGVPNRVPGQMATYAMPGLTTYTQQMQAEQLIAQQKLVTDQRHHLEAAMRANGGAIPLTTAGATGAAQPVLSKRSLGKPGQKELSLVKRGKMLVGGMLAAFGLALGYLQSATQFPEDRQAEKDKKKKDAQKKLSEQQPQDPSMAGGSPAALGSSSGLLTQPSSSGTNSGIYSPSQAGAGLASDYVPAGAAMPANLMPVASSVGANLPASFVPVPMTGAPVLSKRSDDAFAQEAHVEKRLLGMGAKAGRFLEISGLTMFFGTLAANVMVSTKQQSKPVPYVTPNADTKGPVPLGGDLYAKYLESKQAGPIAQSQDSTAPSVPAAATVSPTTFFSATVGGNMPVGDTGLTTPAMGAPILQKRRAFGTSPDPMLNKRLLPGLGLFRAATVVAESSAARTAGVEVAGKAGTILASDGVAAGGVARVAEASAGTGAEAGAVGLRATENTAGGMIGAAQPAMIRMPAAAPAGMIPMGRAGLPGTAAAAQDLRFAGGISTAETGSIGMAGSAGRGVSAIEEPVAGEAAMAPEAVAAKKKNTMSKIGILTTAAGVTMLANGAV